jgi:uncharacterized membrane protein YraQ (UPF0718 family)
MISAMASNGAARVFELLATIVRVVCAVIAALILAHAVFVFFEANPANPLVEFTTGWRNTFAWFTRDLFTTTEPKTGEAINDALAALIYVVLGSLVAKLIVRLAPSSSAKA